MKEIRRIGLMLRSLPDRELLEIIEVHPGPDPRQFALACLEADRRGGVAAIRARVGPIPPVTPRCFSQPNPLASANTRLAFSLLKQLAQEQPDSNIFISPYSIAAMLQMVCHGAVGETREELEHVLGISGWSAQRVNEAHKNLHQSILSDRTDVILDLASAIWCKKETQLRPEFLAQNEEFFGASIEALDFADPQSIQWMNDWAEKNTHGRIKHLVPASIPALTEILLASVVYFKGRWLKRFSASRTKQRSFHLASGKQKQVPMMEQDGKFIYQEGPGFQAVELPYVGRNLAMHVVLPDAHSNVLALVQGLEGDAWQKSVLPRFQDRRGTVLLPRFQLDYDVELSQTLMALGMRRAFGEADFSAMLSTPLFLSAVKQSSFVEVNEEGTEAAAATLATMYLDGIPKERKPFWMIVDRPFLFVIQDNPTESILFMGIVVEPMTKPAWS